MGMWMLFPGQTTPGKTYLAGMMIFPSACIDGAPPHTPPVFPGLYTLAPSRDSLAYSMWLGVAGYSSEILVFLFILP